MSFTYKPSHNIVEVNFTPQTGVAVGTSRRSLKSFPPFGETIVIIPTRKDKAHSLPTPKGGAIPRRFDEHMHIVIDVTRGRKTSTHLFHMPQHVMRHPHISWIVTVGVSQNPIINFGISALSLKSKIRHRDCSHIQAALEFLQHTDSTLPNLTAYEHRLI